MTDDPLDSDLPRPHGRGEPAPLADVYELDADVALKQFGVDVGEYEATAYVPPAELSDPRSGSFVRLAADEREALAATLAERHGEAATRRFHQLVEAWKDSSNPRHPEPQWLERLYRTTFDLETSVREHPDGGRPPAGPIATSRIELLKTLYQLTLTFTTAHHGGRPMLFRGTRRSTTACLFLQAVDDPDREAFRVEADTALNVALMEEPARDFAYGVLFRFTVPQRDLLCAVDQFRLADEPLSDEYHMRGGTLSLPAAAVVHDGIFGDVWQPLVRTVDALANRPGSFTTAMHDDVFEFVRVADEKGYRVGTEAGAERLQAWADALRQHAVYDPAKLRTVQEFVDVVADPDPDAAFWT